MFKRKFRTKSHPILFSIIFLVFVFALNFDKVRLREEFYSALDAFNSLEIGISGLPGLYGRSNMTQFPASFYGIGKTIFKEFPEKVLYRAPQMIKAALFEESHTPNIETLQIDIKFKDWKKILSDRNEAIRNTGLLINRTEVKASFFYNGKRIKGKVRLKGDFNDHWRSTRRMSLMVKLSGKSDAVKGFKRFALHKPEARQHPYEAIFQRLARDLGIISVTHDYIRVVVNGVEWGIMNIQETFSKELLEKQKKKDSLIIKLGNESLRWKITSKYGQKTGYRGGASRIVLDVLKKKKVLQNQINRDRVSYISKNIELGTLENIVDVDKFAKLALLAIIWGDIHVTLDSNSRYYFNPYTLKLEPISSDSSHFQLRPKEYFRNPKLTQIYSYSLNKVIDEGRINNLVDEVHKVIKNVNRYGRYYQSFFPNDFPLDYSILEKNFAIFKNTAIENVDDVYPIDNTGNINRLTIKQWDYADEFVSVRHYSDGRLRIYNLLPIPLTVSDIFFGQENLLDNAFEIGDSISSFNFIEINTGITGIHDDEFTVVSTAGSSVKTAKNTFTHSAQYINPMKKLDRTDGFPKFLTQKTENLFYIASGKWFVENPIVIDGMLEIESGTTLQFSDSAYLMIKGNLIAKGTLYKPIILEPYGKSWKGMYIFQSKHMSELVNVTVRSANFLSDGMLSLSGGITFYNADVSLQYVHIENSQAEDAINVVNSRFLFDGVDVLNSKSDAIDIDFSTGELRNISIYNAKGDGVDFSGSKVLLDNLKISKIKDKGISVGENSHVDVNQALLSDLGVGIAAKDGSYVEVHNIKVDNFKLFAGMTYVKKSMYKYPTMKIWNANFSSESNKNPLFSQTGSTLYIDDNKIQELELDVEALYESEVMKK